MSKEERKLRLYVWPEYVSDYTDGLAFAIAYSEKAAINMVVDGNDWRRNNMGPMIVHELNKPITYSVCGGG